VRPGKDGVDIRQHGLRTRRTSGMPHDWIEIAITNVKPSDLAAGESVDQR
jgi:hypothetical protein